MRALIFFSLLSFSTLLANLQADATNAAPAAPKGSTPSEAAWQAITAQVTALKRAEDRDARIKLDQQHLDSINAFLKSFPHDNHVLNAQMLWAQTADEMERMGLPDAPPRAQIDKAFDALATNPKVPLSNRAEIRFAQIGEELEKDSDSPGVTAANWKTLDDRIVAFENQFGAEVSFDGQTPVILELRKGEVITRKALNDPGLDDLLNQLAKDPVPEVATFAQKEQADARAMFDLMQKPLDLKFTSIDGQPVDLAAWRGKVVLVDFWATWCGPCVEEMPNVRAAYQKLHAQGFEIAGISLDQDKSKLVAFTKANGMTWPQFFDGKGWDNAISSKYGIDSIPTMWLVSKDGLIKTVSPKLDLTAQVERLLKE